MKSFRKLMAELDLCEAKALSVRLAKPHLTVAQIRGKKRAVCLHTPVRKVPRFVVVPPVDTPKPTEDPNPLQTTIEVNNLEAFLFGEE